MKNEPNPYWVTDLPAEALAHSRSNGRFPLLLMFALVVYTGSAMNLVWIGTRASPPNGLVDRQLGLVLGVGAIVMWLRLLTDRIQIRFPMWTAFAGIVVQGLSILVLIYLGCLAPPDLLSTGVVTIGGFTLLFLYYTFRDRKIAQSRVTQEE